MPEVEKGLRDPIAQFLDDPSKDSFRELMRGHVGETENLDFKSEWPKSASLAKHILAMANSGGGCVVVGVTERADGTAEATGLSTLQDKADIQNGLRDRLPPELITKVAVGDFAYETSDYAALAGKKFQVLFVGSDPEHIPFVAGREGDGLRPGAIYVRREGLSVEASQSEVQRLINKRLASGHSTAAEMELKQHFDQLQVLFDAIPRVNVVHRGMQRILPTLTHLTWIFGETERTPNPNYPAEDMQAFVVRMIEAKKKRIERELGLP